MRTTVNSLGFTFDLQCHKQFAARSHQKLNEKNAFWPREDSTKQEVEELMKILTNENSYDIKS